MRIGVLAILCFFQFAVNGQNLPRFAQMNFGQSIQNPAALSIDSKYQVDLMIRNQWFQFDGAPTTVALNGQYEFAKDMAAGLNFYHDRIGVTETNVINGQYAYRLHFDRSNALIFGLGLGVEIKSSDFASTQTTVANDPAFAQSYSKLFFNSSLGIYYYNPRFYIGASIPQMFQNNFGDLDNGFSPKGFHYYMSTGWYLKAGRNYTLNPHIQVKGTYAAPIQGDLILRNTFNNAWSFVVGYRTENSIIVGLDFLITPFMRAGYSFNHDVGKLARFKGMSNELYIGFGMPYRKTRKDFGESIYLNKKGRFQRNYKRNYRRKKGGR